MYTAVKEYYNHFISKGHSHNEAKQLAVKQCNAEFMRTVPENTPEGRKAHEEHMRMMDEFLKEDVPTNSMAGGAIANKPMGLGGVRTHLVKREILRVLGKVRARNRTKVRY